MLYREIIAVCSEMHKKHINTLCGQNVDLLNVKLVVHIVTSSRWPVYLMWLLTEHTTFATLHSTPNPHHSTPLHSTPHHNTPLHSTLHKQYTPSHTNAPPYLQHHSPPICHLSLYAPTRTRLPVSRTNRKAVRKFECLRRDAQRSLTGSSAWLWGLCDVTMYVLTRCNIVAIHNTIH